MALDHVNRKNRRPIECRLCHENLHFLVTHSRGNTLHRGGYGYVLSSVFLEDKNDAVTADDPLMKTSETKRETKGIATSHHYLFIEEVLFLFEQGLLHAFREGKTKQDDLSGTNRDALCEPNRIGAPSQQLAGEEEELLSRYELFQYLELAGVSLPTYLVYQHLRAQTYRVVRHTPTRLKILVQQVAYQNQADSLKNHETPTDVPLDDSIIVEPVHKNGRCDVDLALIPEETTAPVHHRPLQSLKRQLRCDTSQALPPEPGAIIAWDGYHPTSSFSAAAPGLPDFYVAITYMTNDCSETHRTFSYRDVQSLLQQTIIPSVTTKEENDHGHTIPLKIATVSDSGTVLVFGITDFGVPMNHPPASEDAVPSDA